MREYKETNVEWCPTIPSNWELLKVKNCFYISKTQAGEKDPVILKLARSGVQVRDITNNEGQLAESYENYNPVAPGDLLLNPMDLYSGANCNMSEISGVISPAYVNLRATNNLNPKYFDYYFKVQYWTMAMFAHGKGVSFDNRWTINADGVKNYELPFPSKEEQDAIVNTINSKLEKVDSLIANQEAQIEKLKAYKQSLITEVVTKGLDKSVSMKDSGVEFVGKISNISNITRVGHLFDIILGKMVTPEKKLDDDTLESYFCAANVHFDGIQYEDLKKMWFSNYEKDTYLVKKGDLLIVEGGAGAGGSFVVDQAVSNCYIQNSIMIVRAKSFVTEKWLYYMMFFLVSKGYIDYISNKATIPHFTKDKLGNTPIVYYSEEQITEMVTYLDGQCIKIDSLISLKQNKIEKLNQYKKSLIYEYVTGKKEVV